MHNKYQLLMEHSKEIVLFFDKRGQIVECNQTAKVVLGYGEDIYHCSIYDIFRKGLKLHGTNQRFSLRIYDRAIETIAYRKNQTCFTVVLKIIMTPWSRTFHGACIAEDVTEKKRLQRVIKRKKNELKASNKIKNDFIANITHELRTPLNGIIGLTESLFDTQLHKKQQETLNIIHRCCLNMNALVNDLLDFAKIGSNRLILEQREFHLLKFIDDTISCYSNQIQEKGLKLIVNIDHDIPDTIIGDEHRLSQVLNNLFSNAIKFTSVGQIALEVVKTSQTMEEVELFFMVMDSGIGISPEDRDKLFISFSQVDSSITRRYGGTGLGLVISKKLVEAMGGSITVDSEKGKGSTFSFTVRLGVPEHEAMNLVSDHMSLSGETNTDNVEDYLRDIDEEEQETKLKSSYLHPVEEITIDQRIMSTIERLKLCIEMENWEMAEETAMNLKSLMPEKNHKLHNKALALVLSIRKEEYSKSMNELKELEYSMNEVDLWNT